MSLVKYVVSELGVIRQAPIPFFLCLVALSVFIWKAISWRFSAKSDAQESRILLQADQIADYKNKLDGASPDEAAARLEILEAAVKEILPRSLSSEQMETLKSHLSRNPGRAYICLSVTANNKKLLHNDLEKSFRNSGYEVRTWVAQQQNITHDKLSLKVPNIEQLTQRQSLVLTVLRSLNLDVAVEHEPDNPANDHTTDIWLVVR